MTHEEQRAQEYQELCQAARDAADRVNTAQRELDGAEAKYKLALLRRRRMELWLKHEDAQTVLNQTNLELDELEQELRNA